MKRVKYMAGFLLMFGLSLTGKATTMPAEKHEFKNVDREVNFDLERKQGEIALYLQSQFFNSYDEILIEKSESESGNFSVCKTIEVSQVKITGNYYQTIDKYPLNVHKDSYYRIKTVGKDGSMKTFPPVLLSALTR